jgi:aminopeptidase 2
MGATQDLELAKKTLEFMDTKARDQDVMYFFTALGPSNFKTRRMLTQYFQENYDAVCACDWMHLCPLIGDSSTNDSRATFR